MQLRWYLGTSFKVWVVINKCCDVISELLNFSQVEVLMDAAIEFHFSSIYHPCPAAVADLWCSNSEKQCTFSLLVSLHSFPSQ